MQKLLSIAWKETVIRFSSRAELLFFLILPLAFTFILGGGLAGDPSESAQGIRLIVVDEDGSDLSGTLIDRLAADDDLRVEMLSAESAADEFATGATAVLTVPDGFEAEVKAARPVALDLQKEHENSNADLVEQLIQTTLGTINGPLAVAQASTAFAEQVEPFQSVADRSAFFTQSLDSAETQLAQAPQRLVITQPDATVSDNVSYDNAAHQSAGQLVTWVFIPLLGVAAVFAFERTQGTLRRLLTTPTTRITHLLGIVTGHLGHALVQMALLIGFGVLVMNVNWGRSPLGLLIMMVTFGLAGVAFGTMLGTFIKTASQANSVAIMLGMALALLGGCWFPLEIFPPAAQTVAMVLPTRWAMEGFTNLLVRGSGVEGVLLPATVLLGFAVLFFSVGVWRFRYE